MNAFASPMALFLIAVACACMLAAALPFALWYYYRAKSIAPELFKKKELEAQNEKLQGEITDQRTKLIELSDQIVHAKEVIQQKQAAEKWLEETKATIEDLAQQQAKSKADYEIAKGALEDVTGKVSAKQVELAELNKKITANEEQLAKAVAAAEKAIIAQKEEIAKLNAEKAGLTAEVAALRAEKEGLPAEIKHLTEQKLALEKKVESAQEEFANLQKKVTDTEAMLQRKVTDIEAALKQKVAETEAGLQKKVADVESEIKKKLAIAEGELQLKRDELAELQREVALTRKTLEDLTFKVAELEGRAAVATRTIAEFEAHAKENEDKWANLDLAVMPEESPRAFSDINESDWLKELNKNLLSTGFIFNERAIRAFHTGLKCRLTTPLVVLAGISGTGKSLLPELYASALGMNFLPVPVQPRWDSPQDLFGFYNYMEGRYKATELARLLWQFDRYNNEKMKNVADAKLPVNLVLLDEMNLARVEYYFSDLLSKLEMRNGLNPNNGEDRRKAEIELECNASGKQGQTRHLFVSPQTLFVGTMNEDESTQTLSDKVIDRANILRFGRPKDLNAKPRKGEFLDYYRERDRISSAQWEKWCVSLMNVQSDDARLQRLEAVLKPVIAALDVVNRPYGFRVDNAMKTYIVNYPGPVDEAIADQIEMKVLPKLNGLEKDAPGFDPLKAAMHEAINKTGDDAISKAFEKSCPADSGAFFKWRGVMR